MDLDFYQDLEELFHEYKAAGQILTLTDGQKEKINKVEFNYELFRYDFDLTCRFIYFLCRLERFKYSSTYVTLLKYVMVLSTFLKNNTTTKLSSKSESFLVDTTDSLVSDFRIHLQVLPDYVSARSFDSGKMLIAFAVVNIHEIVGISRTVPRNAPVFFFLCNEADLVPSETSLINTVSGMSDYEIVGDAMDETVASSAFKKYSQQPRPFYKKAFENQKLLFSGGLLSLGFMVLIVVSEYCIGRFFP